MSTDNTSTNFNITKTVPSTPDERDYIYVPKETVPYSASLKDSVGFIEDQGQIGSCTANATCSAVELILKSANSERDISRLFNYYCSRDRDNLLGQEGATLRSAIKAAANEGLPLEAVYPYIPEIRDQKPPQSVYDIAKETRLLKYEKIVTKNDEFLSMYKAIKSAISEGYPVVVAMRISDQFLSLKGKTSQEMNYLGCPLWGIPYPYKYAGNHAVIITGYSGDQIDIENSWGTSWGDNGIGYIASTTLDSDVYEAWVIKGFAEVNLEPIKPVEPFVTDPLDVLVWYNQVWRMDVTSPLDEGVLYWARHPGGKNAFLLHWKYLVQLKCDELMS